MNLSLVLDRFFPPIPAVSVGGAGPALTGVAGRVAVPLTATPSLPAPPATPTPVNAMRKEWTTAGHVSCRRCMTRPICICDLPLLDLDIADGWCSTCGLWVL